MPWSGGLPWKVAICRGNGLNQTVGVGVGGALDDPEGLEKGPGFLIRRGSAKDYHVEVCLGVGSRVRFPTSDSGHIFDFLSEIG